MDKHADAVVSLAESLKRTRIDQESWETWAQEQRNEDLRALWAIFTGFDVSQHHRARRVAIARILGAYDHHGHAVVKIAEDIWQRSKGTKNRTRWFLAAMLGEISARKWRTV